MINTHAETRTEFWWTWKFQALYLSLGGFVLVTSLFAGSELVPIFELEADALLRGTSGLLFCIAFAPWILRALEMGPARD